MTTMHPTDTVFGASEFAALEARLQEVFASMRRDGAVGVPGLPSPLVAAADMEFLANTIEGGPSVLTLAQRHATLVPAAGGVGLYGNLDDEQGARIRAAAARIDEAFAVRGIDVPRLRDLTDDGSAPGAALAQAVARVPVEQPVARPAAQPSVSSAATSTDTAALKPVLEDDGSSSPNRRRPPRHLARRRRLRGGPSERTPCRT